MNNASSLLSDTTEAPMVSPGSPDKEQRLPHLEGDETPPPPSSPHPVPPSSGQRDAELCSDALQNCDTSDSTYCAEAIADSGKYKYGDSSLSERSLAMCNNDTGISAANRAHPEETVTSSSSPNTATTPPEPSPSTVAAGSVVGAEAVPVVELHDRIAPPLPSTAPALSAPRTDSAVSVPSAFNKDDNHYRAADDRYFHDSMLDLQGIISCDPDVSDRFFPLIEQRRVAELRGPSATEDAFVGFLIHSAAPPAASALASPSLALTSSSETASSSEVGEEDFDHTSSSSVTAVMPASAASSTPITSTRTPSREIQSPIDPPPLSPCMFGPTLNMSTTQAGVVIKALKRSLAASVASSASDASSSFASGTEDTVTSSSTEDLAALGGGGVAGASSAALNGLFSSGDAGAVAASAMWCAARISAPEKPDMSAETGESFSQLQQQHMEVPVSMAGLVCQLVSRYIDNVSLCAAAVVTLNNIWTSVFSTSAVTLLEVLRKRQRHILVQSKVLETVALVYDHYSVKLSECYSDDLTSMSTNSSSTAGEGEGAVQSRSQPLANAYALLVEHCCAFFISTCQRSNPAAASALEKELSQSNPEHTSASRLAMSAFGYVSAIDGQLYAAIRKKYSAMRLELALVRSMSVICGSIANGVLSNVETLFSKPEERSSLRFTERLIISSCRVGIALADSCEGRAALLYQDQNLEQEMGGGRLNDGIAAALCTVLGLHATHPAVVVWVAKCAYALSVWQPVSHNDSPSVQSATGVDKDRWSVLGHLGQAVAASALAYHSKLLGSPGVVATHGSEEAPKMDRDHAVILQAASHERINRWGAVIWGLKAVGMITCGPVMSKDDNDSDFMGIADVNRDMLVEVGVVDSILYVLKLGQTVLASELIARNQTDLMADAILALEAGCWALTNTCAGTEVTKSEEFASKVSEVISQIVQDAVVIKSYSDTLDSDEGTATGYSNPRNDVDGLIREACIAVHNLAGCISRSKSDASSLLLQALVNLMRYFCSKPDLVEDEQTSATTNSSRVVKYVWYAISGLMRCPNNEGLIDQFHSLKPYTVIPYTFEFHGNNDDTMRYVCSTLASLATHSMSCSEAMAKEGLAQGLVNTLGKFISLDDVVRESAVSLAAVLATHSGKLWLARSNGGIDLLISALTRFSKDIARPVGMFDASLGERIQDEGRFPLVSILESLDPNARGFTAPSHPLLLRDISAVLSGACDRNITLALLIALVHGASPIFPSASSAEAINSAVAETSGILLKMGNAGAVKLIPKLLCGLMHEVVIGAAAANISASKAPGPTNSDLRKVVNIDVTACKWLCRAVGALGGYDCSGLPGASSSVPHERIFVNLLVRPAVNATVAISSKDVFQHGRMNAIKMGHVGEMFDALLLLSLYSASSPVSDSTDVLVRSINRALNALAGAAENHNRLRSVTARIASSLPSDGTDLAPPAVVGLSEVLMSCIENYAALAKTGPTAQARAKMRYLYVGLVDDFCTWTCSLSEPNVGHGGIESSQAASFKDWLGESGVAAMLPSFLSDMLTILDHSSDDLLKTAAEKSMLEVLMATVSAAFRHAPIILSLENTSIVSLIIRTLLKHSATMEPTSYAIDISTAALLLTAVLCDASPRMRKAFADLGLVSSLHKIFAVVNDKYSQNAPLSVQRITSAMCRVISSIIWSERSVNDGYLKSGNYYNNLYGGFESSSTTHSLRGVLKKFIADRRGAMEDIGGDGHTEVVEARTDGYYRGAGRAALSALSSAGSILSGMTSSLVATLSNASVGGLGMADSAKKALQLDDSGPFGANLISIDGTRTIAIESDENDSDSYGFIRSSALMEDVLAALSLQTTSNGSSEVFVLPQILLAIAGFALNDPEARSLFGRLDVAKFILCRDFAACSLVTVHHALLAVHGLAADNHVENVSQLMDAGAIAFLEFVAKHHIANAEYVAWSFCRAVDELAMDQRMHVSSDVVDGLLVALIKHIRSPRVCVWALRALSKLMHDPSVRMRLCASTYGTLGQSLSAVQVVQRALMRQGMAVPIAQWGCLCLKSFSLDTTGAGAIVKSGGLETVSACMVQHPMDGIIALRCCTLLTSLVFISADSSVANENAAAGAKALGLVRSKIASNGIPDALVGLLLARRISDHSADPAPPTSQEALQVLVSIFDCLNALIDGASIRDRLCVAGVCEILPEILHSYVHSCDVTVAAASALSTLVDRHEAASVRLVKAGAIVVLMAAMKIHETNVDVMDAVCNAVSKLAQVRENREVMGADGCIHALVNVLAANRNYTSPALQCCWALSAIASDVPTNGHVVAELGVCEIVVELRLLFPTNESLAIAICRLIAQIGNEELALELATIYVLLVDVLKAALAEHKEKVPHLVEWACRAIGAVAVSTKSRLLLGSCKAPEALTEALSYYIPCSAIVTREAIFALSCVCEGNDVGSNIDQIRDQAGKLAVAAIQAYYEDADVVWCSCKLFISLSSRPEFLLDLSVGDYVISVMQKHYKNSMVTEWGCKALASLSSDEKYRDILVGRGACDAIVQALKASVSGGSVMSFMVKSLSSNIVTMLGGAAVDRASLTQSALGASACSTIFSLADTHDEYRQRLGDAGACEAVVKVLLKFSSESPDVAGAACQAIVSLCRSSPMHRLKLGNAGACKGITTVLHKYVTDETVSYLACAATVALIPDATYIECSGELSNRGGRPCHASKHRSVVYSTANEPQPTPQQESAVYESSNPDGAFISEYQKLNAAKMGGVEGCDAIAMALQTHQSSERLARVGCWAVALLAGLDADILVRLGTVGACEAVVTMLQRHSRQPAVCEAGCIALARLGVNSGNSGWLGAAGGCTVVLDALNKHPDHNSVGRAGWAAIASLACDEGNRSRFGLLSGCEAAVRTISRIIERNEQPTDQSDPSDIGIIALYTVAEECCTAISQLCKDSDNLNRLYALRAPEVIIRVLQSGSLPSGLSASACSSIASLVANNGSRRQLLGELGACDAVVSAMIAHSKEPIVQMQGCIALHTLSLKHPGNQTLIGNASGCEVLLNVLRLHGWSVQVAEQVCRAINTLILEHVENQVRMGSGDACKLIVSTIKVHMRSSFVVNRASCALFNLTVDSALCREQTLAADGAATLVTALQDHLPDEPVCVRVALTLKTLTFEVEGQAKLGESGVAKYLVKALSIHEGSAAAAPLLLSVIAAFVLNHSANQSRMNAAGAPKTIVSVAYKHINDPATVMEACNTMLAIGDGNEDCKAKLASVGATELFTAVLQLYSQTSSPSSSAAGEIVELAQSCRAMLATKAASTFFGRQFSF